MITPELAEAIDAERDRVRETIAKHEAYLESLDDFAQRHNGSDPAPSSEATKPEPRRAPKRKPAKRAKQKPAAREQAVKPPPDGRAAGQHARGKASRQKILDAVRAEPGLNGGEVAERTGLDKSTVSTHIRALLSGTDASKALRVERDGTAKRYYPAEADLAPADADGAKTKPERKVLEALQAAPVALTTQEVAANSGVGFTYVAPILQAFTRRGLVRALPRKSENDRARWELAKTTTGA